MSLFKNPDTNFITESSLSKFVAISEAYLGRMMNIIIHVRPKKIAGQWVIEVTNTAMKPKSNSSMLRFTVDHLETTPHALMYWLEDRLKENCSSWFI